jgi:ABC-2 type transport system permease protein
MNTTHWSGVRLVAGRVITEGLASTSWRIMTALLLLLGLAVVVVPRLVGDEPTRYTLASVGEVPGPLLSRLQATAAAGEFEITVMAVSDVDAARAAVRDGDADVALTEEGPAGRLYVGAQQAGTFPVLVSQAIVSLTLTERLAAAGLSPDQIAAIRATPPPEQVPVGRVADEGRAGVGFVVGIVLYLALILAGTTIATAVATEKSTRISEVLLAVLRPRQLLVGTVLGVGALALSQIAALVVPTMVGVVTSDALDLPAAAATDVLLGVVWFAAGLLLYAFAFAALGALVDKPTDVGSATLPANMVLIGSYLLAVTVTVADPNSWVSVAASLFPLSAPLVMPVRWASGLVPGWQLVLALVLTVTTSVWLARFAAQIYARGLARSGRRVSLREVLSG